MDMNNVNIEEIVKQVLSGMTGNAPAATPAASAPAAPAGNTIPKKARVAMVTGEVFGRKVVPVNTYWVMSGSTPIGYATLKHEATYDKPGGHIGCCLKKEYQNQGIGTIVSDILSSIAYHDLGITELIYSSKSENTQSQKSVDKIGGTLVAVNNGYHFYKVDLEKRFNNERRVIK